MDNVTATFGSKPSLIVEEQQFKLVRFLLLKCHPLQCNAMAMEWHPLERDFTAYSLVLFSNRSNKNKNIFSSPDFARRKIRNPLKQIFSILILVSLLILFFALFYTFYISASTLDVAHSQSPAADRVRDARRSCSHVL